MSNEQNPEQKNEEPGLDNWYGAPKRVGKRDYLVGFLLMFVTIMTMVIFFSVKDMRDAANKTEYIKCPNCEHVFEN